MGAMLRQAIAQFDVMAYPIAALVLFLAVFGLIIVRARRLPSAEVDHLAALPLDQEP
jgi:hypothetical protein